MEIYLAKHLSSFSGLAADNFPAGVAKDIPSFFYWCAGTDFIGLVAYSNRPGSKLYCRKSYN